MATATAPFNAYKITYYSSYVSNFSNEALIQCFQNTTFVGQIEFHKTDLDMGSAIKNGNLNIPYRIDRFRDVHQLLLHEKPLHLFVNEAIKLGSVGTAEYEPTGEEE
jgi:hypothetical protein